MLPLREGEDEGEEGEREPIVGELGEGGEMYG